MFKWLEDILDKKIDREVQEEMSRWEQIQNEILARKFLLNVKQAGLDRYHHWRYNFTEPYVGFRSVGYIVVGSDHRERFPRPFSEYVQEEFDRIREESHTKEEQLQIQYDQIQQWMPFFFESFEDYKSRK